MAVGLALLGISGKTPFAYIGQRGLALFDDHPMFELRALIADDPADVGKPLGEAVQGRWLLDEPLPDRWAGEILQPLDAGKLRDNGVELVLSGLPGPHARELDPVLAAGGLPVVSESAGLRLEPDVPLVVTEVNADHLALTRVQKQSRGYGDGYLVASPVCTAVIAAIAAKPLIDRFGLKGSVYTTLQALSGAGPTGVPGMYVVDNVLPFIQDEEEKLRNELAKILGTYENDAITPHPAPAVGHLHPRAGARRPHDLGLAVVRAARSTPPRRPRCWRPSAARRRSTPCRRRPRRPSSCAPSPTGRRPCSTATSITGAWSPWAASAAPRRWRTASRTSPWATTTTAARSATRCPCASCSWRRGTSATGADRGRTVPVDELVDRLESLLELAWEDGALAARALVEAELLGLPAFGVALLAELEAGDRAGPVLFEQTAPATAAVDAGGCFGPVAAAGAARIAGRLAEGAGVGAVALHGVGGIGRLAPFVAWLAERGFGALFLVHSPAMVAPAGGRRAVLGTNPLAFALPAPGGPVVGDVATAAITRAALREAQASGRPLPAGAAVDADGEPTTDAAAAAALLPFGGAKGTVLAIMVEALAGALLAAYPAERRRGALLVAFAPAALGDGDTAASAEALREALRDAGGHVPGERAARAWRDASEVTLTAESAALLERLEAR